MFKIPGFCGSNLEPNLLDNSVIEVREVGVKCNGTCVPVISKTTMRLFIRLVEAGNTSTVEASCSQVRMCANLTIPSGIEDPSKTWAMVGTGQVEI